jgi:hypothetical protein
VIPRADGAAAEPADLGGAPNDVVGTALFLGEQGAHHIFVCGVPSR